MQRNLGTNEFLKRWESIQPQGKPLSTKSENSVNETVTVVNLPWSGQLTHQRGQKILHQHPM